MGRNWTRRSIEEIFDNLFKKYAKEGGASAGDVGIPYEYTSTGSVSIGQQAATFWLTPEIKRTSSAPVLKLDGKTLYYNTIHASSGTRISMFSFDRSANGYVPSLMTALEKLRFYNVNSGGGVLSFYPFTKCYFTVNGATLYKVNFTSSTHEIFSFVTEMVDVSSVDPSIYFCSVFKPYPTVSVDNFNNLYNALDNQGVLPANATIKFIFFTSNSNFTDDDVKNICETYWTGITSMQTVTV